MSAPTTRRNPFDGISSQDRDEALRKLADLIDRQSRILGEPTPEDVKPHLSINQRR